MQACSGKARCGLSLKLKGPDHLACSGSAFCRRQYLDLVQIKALPARAGASLGASWSIKMAAAAGTSEYDKHDAK